VAVPSFSSSFIDSFGLIRVGFFDGRSEICRESQDDLENFDFAFDMNRAGVYGLSASEYLLWVLSHSDVWSSEAKYKNSYIDSQNILNYPITDIYIDCHGYSSTSTVAMVLGPDATGASDDDLYACADPTKPETQKAKDFFTVFGDTLDALGSQDAKIHLRSCDAGAECTYSAGGSVHRNRPMLEVAAKYSGHVVTGCDACIDMIKEKPLFMPWSLWEPVCPGADYKPTAGAQYREAVPVRSRIKYGTYWKEGDPSPTEWNPPY
jgi:hypothetical protein